MAINNPTARRLALQKIIGKHPEFSVAQAEAAMEKLDAAGVLSVSGTGQSVLVNLNDQSVATVLEAAPNLLEIAEVKSPIARSMVREVRAGKPVVVADADKYRAAVSKLPKAGVTERSKLERAMAKERALADAGFGGGPNGGG